MNKEPTIREMLQALSQKLTQIQISKLTTIPQSSISKILNEELTEVTYSRGKKLQKLYEQEVCI
ncbi:transcriptional regulator [Acinetobacter gerneri]|uniref:Transcriptional regulator n=1 Tax=Acinetobacter gerneri TaxID=202952 RepID=A0AAW8JIN2_9GAMM|nr:transcriptional regulator [Acinetobacter gerneri]MDQ9009006.1 transcriptional regulator [Acinetobacter gerneri]MDQ9013110.1 transcriptional regulator [Acinetobacter gerneri]MDQ9024547.1 transcriptional regulator [Acinetobacter gerneri]MDQ9051782.1 transcriptional regulator [Acinetobacter gerneri]MDQ9059238.1 transcriptional regulator [Acinetobacter gerneri]